MTSVGNIKMHDKMKSSNRFNDISSDLKLQASKNMLQFQKSRTTVEQLLSTLVLFFGFFPYVKIVPIASDTQPFFVVFCFLYLCVIRCKFPRSLLIVLLVVLSAIMIAYAVSFQSFYGMRSLFNYITIPLGTIAVYSILVKRRSCDIILKWAIVSLWIYLFAGFLQILLGPDVLAAFINVRTSISRGVTSLCSEPNYFGAMVFFCYLLINKFGSSRQKTFTFIAVVIVNMVMISSAISLFLFMCVCVQFARTRMADNGWSYRLLFGVILLALASIFQFSLESSAFFEGRMQKLFSALWQLDFYILFLDGSASGRFSSVFMGLYGSVSNWFLPTIPGSYEAFYAENIHKFRYIFPFGNPTERPMSGIAIYTYDFGVIGIAAIAMYFSSIILFFRESILMWAGILFMTLMVFPFSQPVYAILFGVYLAWSKIEKERQYSYPQG